MRRAETVTGVGAKSSAASFLGCACGRRHRRRVYLRAEPLGGRAREAPLQEVRRCALRFRRAPCQGRARLSFSDSVSRRPRRRPFQSAATHIHRRLRKALPAERTGRWSRAVPKGMRSLSKNRPRRMAPTRPPNQSSTSHASTPHAFSHTVAWRSAGMRRMLALMHRCLDAWTVAHVTPVCVQKYMQRTQRARM